jgi:hypothetical protein
MKLEFPREIFEKSSNIRFHENPTSGSRVVPCGRTHKEANRRFSHFITNASKKMISKMCSEHQKAGLVLYESRNAAFIQLSFVMGVDGWGVDSSSSSNSNRPKLY